MKLNERTWAGHIVSWIKQEIANGQTLFEEATNDTGIKMESGVTKFPDILLFTDKVSGVVFNGWELKFPDTAADDRRMLENALEKAQTLKSDSFVTWNGREAIIWKINTAYYSFDSLSVAKRYKPELGISLRSDLSDPANYLKNEPKLRALLSEILADLGEMYRLGSLKEAINISDNFIEAIGEACQSIVPQFDQAIREMKGKDEGFRLAFNTWKMYERSALKMLSTSSRKKVELREETVLARFAFYNLIGKVLFYHTLSANLSGRIEPIEIKDGENVKLRLGAYFQEAMTIDYQAVFQPYFTDSIPFSQTVDKTLLALLRRFDTFQFRILPTDTIGYIFENLVPQDEKLRFGQYFTSQVLANLVAYPAIRTNQDVVFDPTAGTGAFLLSAYQILKYHGKLRHGDLLSQVWGNDISHFPAILSVVNLHRQEVKELDNYPRIIRDDFFNLHVGKELEFPDPKEEGEKWRVLIPKFNAIVSNFPFVQQEDIPKSELSAHFKKVFQNEQSAFGEGSIFKINERADYFTYCAYHALQFLEDDGRMSVITSNAWLGKEYGLQFKKFLLDNFHIKYIIRSEAEHWFSDSQVSTIFTVLHRGKSEQPTKFVTLNFKLQDYFNMGDSATQLKQIEELYFSIDTCYENGEWEQDETYDGVFHHKKRLANATVVPNATLKKSLASKENWESFFVAADIFAPFESVITKPFPRIYHPFRGTRTSWNKMFVLKEQNALTPEIEPTFLTPYVKSPKELTRLKFSPNYHNFLFTCESPLSDLVREYPKAHGWIKQFENAPNSNGSRTIAEANATHKPFWYSLRPSIANIVTSINPYERFFFTYSETGFAIDQRLVAFSVHPSYDTELIAAILNSVHTFLRIEMKGTSRYDGVLDLNANYFKSLPILDPDRLSEEGKAMVKSAFRPLLEREIFDFSEEILRPDRKAFDAAVLKAFGLDERILPSLYRTLLASVKSRIEMKNRSASSKL